MVVPALVARYLLSKPIRYHEVLDLAKCLSVHVTKGFRPDWHSVNDRVGWVDRDAASRISDAITKKSQELPRYRQRVGSDVRLLIVADRIYNSGKLALDESRLVNLQGFRTVYFYSRPESVTVFDGSNA